MARVTDLAPDERRARMLLSILSEPNDAFTGRVLGFNPSTVRVNLLRMGVRMRDAHGRSK